MTVIVVVHFTQREKQKNVWLANMTRQAVHTILKSLMKWVYNDGGRAKYFSATKVADCVTRAIAIATNRDYKEIYNEIKKVVGYTPRNGVYKKDSKKVMEHFGFMWHSCSGIGKGCKVHLVDNEIPMQGAIICQVTKHVTCVVNGVINDTFDPSRGGTRCVYGYWTLNE